MPAARFSSTYCSRWKRSSLSRSSSTRFRRARERNRIRTISHLRRSITGTPLLLLGHADHQSHGFRQALPLRQLLLKLRATGLGQIVELGFAPGLGLPPCGADPTLLLQTMQRRIQRALGNLQHVLAHLLDTFGDGPAVLRFERDGAENRSEEHTS